jgi:hypothetical protein
MGLPIGCELSDSYTIGSKLFKYEFVIHVDNSNFIISLYVFKHT